jgi:hypothetical protein
VTIPALTDIQHQVRMVPGDAIQVVGDALADVF